MDLTSIAFSGTAAAAFSSAGSNALSDIQTSLGGDSFKGILGDMMNSVKDTPEAEVFAPEQFSADVVTEEVMSESTETALKYLVGSYLQSAARFDDSGETGNIQLFDFLFTDGTDISDSDYTDMWQQIFDSLTSTDISQISSFSAELSTALFGGGKDGEKSSGDVLAELFDNIDIERMKAQSKDSERILDLAAAAAGGFSSLISFADISPEKEEETQLDMQLTALMGAADDVTVEELASELAEAVSAAAQKLAAEGTANVEKSDEGFEGMVSETIAADIIPDTEDISAKDTAPADKPRTAEKTGTVHGQLTDTETADIAEPEITFISFARRNVRTAGISEEDGIVTEDSGKTLPRIVTDTDEADDNAPAAENILPGQQTTAPVSTDEKTEAPEETGFKTMEQIIEKLEEQAEGFTESRELVIKLTPETLGEITVKIEKAADGAVSVTFAAENRQVNELIADRSAQLAQALSDKGTEVSSVNVVEPAQSGQDLAFDMSGGQNAFNFRQQGMGQHQRTDGVRFDGEEEDDISVSGIAESTEADYVAKEAKLWRKI